MIKFYSLFLAFLLILSCKNETLLNSDDSEVNHQTNYNFGSSVQKNFQGVVLSTDGSPIIGATVTIGTSSVTTNLKGIFIFKNASVTDNFAHIKVSKAGFVTGSRVMVPTNGMNQVKIMMIPATTTSTISTGTTATVSLSNGTKVKFDGSFKESNGNAYSGPVKVALFHLAPSDPYLNELMPGSFLATRSNGEAQVMETFGMVHVQLTGNAGQNLQIATGHTAEMTVAIDPLQMSTAPSTIPLWSFNESTGMWNEEGSAIKLGNNYVGNVSHFSWWNCDVYFPQATLKTTVKNSAGQVLPNIKVSIQRISQVYEVHGFTDNFGMVSGIVPSGEVLALKVYDICNNAIYTSNVGPLSVGSVTVLPDIIVNPPVSTSYTIQGNLKTCSNVAVTDGYVMLRNVGSSTSNYFNYLSVPVDPLGAFTFNTYVCSPNPQFIYEGVDITNLQTTNEIPFTATSTTVNLGNIQVCNSVAEFVSYKIDNQPIQYVLGPFDARWSGLSPSTNPNAVPKQLIIYSSQPIGSHFFMRQDNMMGVAANFTTDYILEFSGGNFNSTNGNVVVNISNFGVVGDFIDFTVNGTYTTGAVNHTFTATGHVRRDN